MSKPCDNENRTRYYGKRVGDIVEYTCGWPQRKERATVVGYAMSIRKDTGKSLITIMTMAQYIVLRGTANNDLLKKFGWRMLEAAALRQNLETHFEAEIKAAKEAVKL